MPLEHSLIQEVGIIEVEAYVEAASKQSQVVDRNLRVIGIDGCPRVVDDSVFFPL